MRNYDAIKNTGSGFLNWPTGSTRYRLREDGKSCAEAEAEFLALSPPDKLAFAPLTAIPQAATGKHWEPSNCGGNATYAEVDDTEFFGSTGELPVTTTDDEAGQTPIDFYISNS